MVGVSGGKFTQPELITAMLGKVIPGAYKAMVQAALVSDKITLFVQLKQFDLAPA